MPKSYRIRTQPNVDKQIRVKIDQDFDFLEILSLKLRQEEVYTRFCADYGVVVGRVIANGGFGVPNVNVSIFIPLDELDENDPIISTLYPYKNLREKNEDGYRYNLLPYVQEYDGHTPTGTFPDRNDLLTRSEVLEVYEKYYKYTVKTNDSGDFMIVGVPLGQQKIVMDLDLSNIGEFSLRPADLVRMGMGVPSQFNGQQFKSSEDIDSLPQIINSVQDIDVSSFWGDDNVCDVGITRVDFDLRALGIEIQPHAIFMGSIFSSTEQDYLKRNCKVKKNTGNLCDTVAGPGKILSIRQTIDVDENGDPVLEEYKLDNNGYVIDDNGAWLYDLPMNMDYVVTNEFGEQIISDDPKVGIPTRGKYRFKIKWMDESGLEADIMRANYLVPNIRENGWNGSNISNKPTDEIRNKSYAFSLNWDDYYDKQAAINCEDSFYDFHYNKVYTVASHIDRFKWGYNRASHLGIKEVTDRACQSEVNRFPINDAQRNFDFLFFIFNLLITIIGFILPPLVIVIHIAMFIYRLFMTIISVILRIVNGIIYLLCKGTCWIWNGCDRCKKELIPLPDEPEGRGIALPMISYPDCEACPCSADTLLMEDSELDINLNAAFDTVNTSIFADVSTRNSYEWNQNCEAYEEIDLAKRTLLAGYDYSTNYDIQTNVDWENDQGYTDYDQEIAETQIGYYRPFINYRQPSFFKSPVYVNSVHIDDFYSDRPDWLANWLKASGVANSASRVEIIRTDGRVTLGQSLNLMNRRAQYFLNDNEGPNRIRTKLRNFQFNPNQQQGIFTPTSDTFDDLPLIVLLDPETLLESGQLITFQNLENINDPNVTLVSEQNYQTNVFLKNTNTSGETSDNELLFSWEKSDGTTNDVTLIHDEEYTISDCIVFSSITVTTPSGSGGLPENVIISQGSPCYNDPKTGDSQYNQYTYIPKNVTWIDHNGNTQQSTVHLFNTATTLNYNFKTGVEYFQVITAHTISELQNGLVNGSNNSCVLNKFLLKHYNNYYCGWDDSYNVIRPIEYFQNYENLVVTFLVRGVDPFTPRQTIEYDLSLLFGNSWGTNKIMGEYLMNIPIQPNGGDSNDNWWDSYKSPINHFDVNLTISTGGVNGLDITWDTNKNGIAQNSLPISNVFYSPYLFSMEQSDYESFFTNSLVYYSSLDKSLVTDNLNFNNIIKNSYFFNGIGTYNDEDGGTNYMSQSDQKISEGATIQATNQNNLFNPLKPNSTGDENNETIFGKQSRTLSLIYSGNSSSPSTMMINSDKIIIRSDRLPSSDLIETFEWYPRIFRRYIFHLNNNFAVYLYNDDGSLNQVFATPGEPIGVTDSSGDSADYAESESSLAQSGVLESFNCPGMVQLECYDGEGESFGINSNCEENDRVVNGCYKIVQRPYVTTIGTDIRLVREWRIRLRFMFAACRGVIGDMFQNNWVNGTLYLPTFQKLSVFNSDNVVESYRYCGEPNGPNNSAYNGPIYFNTETNNFYYRSTPYGNGTFYGQTPSNTNYRGQNQKNIWFPTTIAELGPRDEFTKQVSYSPEFEGYMIDTLTSTSYKDNSDIINLFIIGRLVNATFWQNVINLGGASDASINSLFSRENDVILNNFFDSRVDGDYAQMVSINSEYGVTPYLDGNYYDSITVSDNRFGIWFKSNTINRKLMTDGTTTFGTNPDGPSSYYGFNKSQEVPYYMWKIQEGANLFGTQSNTWNTNLILSSTYQGDNFMDGSSNRYMQPDDGYGLGYIFNRSSNDPELDQIPVSNPNSNSYKVGSPFHFYFGQKRGKTALNKFIVKYIFLNEVES